MGLLLDIVYAAGLFLASPLILYRMIRYGRYYKDLGERFGAVPIRYTRQPIIWLHGVSLGEINIARTLVDEIHAQLPDYRVVISTTTATGMAAAKKLFEPDHIVFRWPVDFSLVVRKALRRLSPDLVVLIEGEAWPNFLAACNKKSIPTIIVNARMSADKGYPRYKMLGPIAKNLFNRLTAICAQESSYADMYRKLGVSDDKLHVTGMVKFDSAEISDHIAGQDELTSVMKISPEDQFFVAGGTGPGEESQILDVYQELLAKHPKLKLAIIPRKPERFGEVAKLILSRGFTLARRSEYNDGEPALNGVASSLADTNAVILGDTMGELRKYYALATCVFVGRSLVPMGGSDMIEAAALAKPTAFGPFTHNFPQADNLASNGCSRVADSAELKQQLDLWLADPISAKAAGMSSQEYVASQTGATAKNVKVICQLLGRTPALAPGGIATDIKTVLIK